MSKNLVLIITLIVILITAILTLVVNASLPKAITKSEIDTAVNQARHLYRQEKDKQRDFSSGLCLSDALMPNWVLDIVHNPRLSEDDRVENQCPAYVEGRSQHFVELDPDGNLIRAE